jgi:predicted dehydrogenase
MTLRWGIIGAGGVARRRTMPAIRQARSAELKALMVRDKSKADNLAREFGVDNAYDDWRALLQDTEVDAVHIATPVHLHEEQVVAAAEAGKHVLCDKPMAMSTLECRRMIEACKANGVHMQVCFLMRFGSTYRRLRRQISEGRFGEILEARASIFKWLPLTDDSWRVIPEQGGGGPLMDLGAHSIDLLTFLLGPIKRVSALCSNRVTKWRVEDTASVLMQTEAGAHAIVGNSFRARGGDIMLEINGTEATVLISTPPGEKAVIRTTDSDGVRTEPVPVENYYQLQVEHFADCIGEKGDLPARPVAPAEDGLRNIAIIEAAYRSAESGRQEQVVI